MNTEHYDELCGKDHLVVGVLVRPEHQDDFSRGAAGHTHLVMEKWGQEEENLKWEWGKQEVDGEVHLASADQAGHRSCELGT